MFAKKNDRLQQEEQYSWNLCFWQLLHYTSNAYKHLSRYCLRLKVQNICFLFLSFAAVWNWIASKIAVRRSGERTESYGRPLAEIHVCLQTTEVVSLVCETIFLIINISHFNKRKLPRGRSLKSKYSQIFVRLNSLSNSFPGECIFLSFIIIFTKLICMWELFNNCFIFA